MLPSTGRRCSDVSAALIHETEAAICECGHTALAHHGLDSHERRDAGCQTRTMRDDWCRCVKTCQMVMEEQ